MIIHINGMPGVGKLTVGKILAHRLSAHLVDNHLLIDLITSFSERGSDLYFLLIERFMDCILENIKDNSHYHYIFTNSLVKELSEDKKRLDQISHFCEIHNILFIEITLFCDLSENKTRIISEERKQKGKLLDSIVLDDIFKQYTIYQPNSTNSYTLDTTNLTPEETATKIIEFIDGIK